MISLDTFLSGVWKEKLQILHRIGGQMRMEGKISIFMKYKS